MNIKKIGSFIRINKNLISFLGSCGRYFESLKRKDRELIVPNGDAIKQKRRRLARRHRVSIVLHTHAVSLHTHALFFCTK